MKITIKKELLLTYEDCRDLILNEFSLNEDKEEITNKLDIAISYKDKVEVLLDTIDEMISTIKVYYLSQIFEEDEYIRIHIKYVRINKRLQDLFDVLS